MEDVAVVGAGPAGAACALGVLAARPGARVVLLDRADFPRDKVCGDGVPPHTLDVLDGVGAGDLLDGWPVAPRLRISVEGGPSVEQAMVRPAQVVPRVVFDDRLLQRARERGARLRRVRVRSVAQDGSGAAAVTEDGEVVRARVVVGADGAHSVVRRGLADGAPPAPVAPQPEGTTAIAVRGYAPVLPEHDGVQVLAFGASRERPCYAWSFPLGDGRANVGYGELVPAGRASAGRSRPTRASLVAALERLIPGASAAADGLAGHPLPLSTGRPAAWGVERVLLAGDAASLVNPVTGEGIYYAVLSGVLAGRAAAASLDDAPAADRAGGAGTTALARYTAALSGELGAHLRHTDLAARLVRSDALLHAAVRAAGADPGAFDDLAAIGLARGRVSGRVVRGIARALVPFRPAPAPAPPTPRAQEAP